MVRHRGLVVGARLGDDDDVCESDVRVFPILIAIRENLSGDTVTRMQFRGDAWVDEPVVHRHRFHEPGDIFAVESDVAATRSNNLPADRKGLRLAPRALARGCRNGNR